MLAVVAFDALDQYWEMDSGLSNPDAIDRLQSAGPNVFDDANNIIAIATVIYCPWHERPQ
jgi:hypothetical protein